jgi:hypothetical protein
MSDNPLFESTKGWKDESALTKEIFMFDSLAASNAQGSDRTLHNEFCRLSMEQRESLVNGITELGKRGAGWLPWTKDVSAADNETIGLRIIWGDNQSISVSTICKERSER